MPFPLKLFTLQTANATGTGVTASLVHSGEKSFQAGIVGDDTCTATVKIQVSNDPTILGWADLGTINLTSSSGADNGGFVSEGAWSYYRSHVTAISGAGATVTVISAQEP